jgi:hypothetical protein
MNRRMKMAKRLPEDYSIEIKEPTVSEMVLKFMFEIDKHLDDYSIRMDRGSFNISGNFKSEDK